jgi:hypothetical protein
VSFDDYSQSVYPASVWSFRWISNEKRAWRLAIFDPDPSHDSMTLCMVRRTIARALSNERSSLLLCIRPSGGDVSPGHDEFRACLF